MYASTSALDRLGRISVRLPCRQLRANAADLIWEVENPFRFFKPTRSFALHEAAFNAVRGDPSAPLPADIVWRTERALNDPDCKDASTPDRCAATAGKRYQQSRLGWAAQTLGETCYESNGRPRRYSPLCERKYSWGTAKEDYVLPEAHTVAIRIAPEQLAGVTGDCIWSLAAAQGRRQDRDQAHRLQGQAHHRARALCARSRAIPASRSRSSCPTAASWRAGGRGRGSLHRGARRFIRLGRKQSGPAGAIQRRARNGLRSGLAARGRGVAGAGKGATPGYGLASGDDQYNPKVLPRRLHGRRGGRSASTSSSSPEFAAAFEKASARWLSRDCHRSQYGYPFRVAIELALENRHRSVTLASFTCSGAEVTEGLFLDMDPREGAARFPAARCARSSTSSAICSAAAPRSQSASYTLPVYTHGSTQISRAAHQQDLVPAAACASAPIDVVLMSIGGNDVGFGALAAYALTENVGRPRADRRPGRALESASGRRCRASISTCWTSA